VDAPCLCDGIDLFLWGVWVEVGVGAVAVLSRIGGTAPSVHGSLVAVLVARGCTGVEGAVMMKHWGQMREAGERKKGHTADTGEIEAVDDICMLRRLFSPGSGHGVV